MNRLYSFASALVLGLGVLAFIPATSQAGGVLPNTLDYTFKLYATQAPFWTPMPVAFDGTNFWATSGGGSPADYHQYNALTGDVITSYNPGLDSRSTFADSNGAVFASGYNDNQIYKMTTPGVLTPVLTLDTSSVSIIDQAPVILSPDGNFYASRQGNTINLWNIGDGSFASSLLLPDYGNAPGEDSAGTSQTDLDLAAFGSYWLTYSEFTNMVYAWDSAGNRVGDTLLLNNGNASAYAFSYSHGYIFTNSVGDYFGYALTTSSSAPEPGTLALAALGMVGLALRRRR